MATGVDARLLKSTKFPPEFSQKVDMQKVNLQVMKKWIASKISDILGSEDDVVIELVFNLIEGPRYPDIKSLQIQLTGFLDKDTAAFCKDLWKLLLSAQSSPQGVPKELLEAKKLELMQEKIEADRAAETAKQRRDDWDRRDREVADLKDRDRRDRAAVRGDTWQGRRGDRESDNRVTFREADVVVVAQTMTDGNHLLAHGQDRPHLDRARRVAAYPAAQISRTADEGLHLQEDKQTDARGHDHPEEIHTGVGQINVLKEVAQLAHLDLYPQTGILLRRNADGTPHQGVVR
ncbi:Serine/arginine repetitive matrix protein 1 [Fusarium austroafricanum]|uniref:Serine/arginine repetitive matrix protein 1 n=2 Tax=Fusarium TaxID=5506 RepID=A0A8H4NXX6_9HYPO|nr:Serine/arginine repetitive matrix protein 1 [Fusarium austroafricanum]